MKRSATTLLVAAMAALGTMAGCGDGGSPAPAAPPAPAAGAPAAPAAAAAPSAPAAGGGAYDPSTATATIVVKATAKGDLPKMRNLKFDADPECGKQHTTDVPEEGVVAADGKLANVMAYVAKGAEGKSYASPSEAVVLDQRGCMYHPHVFTVMVNQPISIKNSDPTMHNIHAVPKAQPEFNKSMIRGAKDLTQKFAKEEIGVKIKCDVHGWMLSWAGVFSHPFHGVTGADGTVKLKVPPGDYEIAAWHEYDKFAKPAAQKVTVGKGETKEIEFVFEIK